MTKPDFRIRPTRWRDWINPWWWQRARVINMLMNQPDFVQAVQREVDRKMIRWLLYGEAL